MLCSKGRVIINLNLIYEGLTLLSPWSGCVVPGLFSFKKKKKKSMFKNILSALWFVLQILATRGSISHDFSLIRSDQIRSVAQSCRLFATPWIAVCQASLSITSSRSSLRLTFIESVMPSSHLILCRPLLLLPPIPPSINLFQWVNSLHEVAKVLEFQL